MHNTTVRTTADGLTVTLADRGQNVAVTIHYDWHRFIPRGYIEWGEGVSHDNSTAAQMADLLHAALAIKSVIEDALDDINNVQAEDVVTTVRGEIFVLEYILTK